MLVTPASQQLISTTFIFTLISLVLAFIYWFGYGRFQHFKRDGLKGPKPVFFLGHIFDFLKHKWKIHLLLDSYYKTYGRVFGMYLRSMPTIVVSDPDMLKQILVKDFTNFHDRPSLVETPEPQASMMLSVKGERWKFIRSTLTPSFTSGKMRPMSGLMNEVTDGLIATVKAKAEQNEAVDFVKLQQGVTMEAILSAAFGMDAKSQSDNNKKLVEVAKSFFRIPWWVGLVSYVPFSYKFLKYIPSAVTSRFDGLANVCRKIIAQRKSGGAKRQDSLQFMLEAQQTPDSNGRTLTDGEIIAQSVVFLAAGYETSSTTLAITCYNLAMNPVIQDKLYDEILNYWPEDNMPGHDDVQKMVYLDQVISETLRICPPGFILFRTCNDDCVINGVQFRNGYGIVVPVYSIHHDPSNWDEPEKFDPDRFSPEAKRNRNPFVYLPFGQGPRNCIGMRFAQMEMKIVLARLLKEFKLERAEETQVPLIPVAQATLSVTHPIMLRVVKRQEQ